jgi:hypothetical protein
VIRGGLLVTGAELSGSAVLLLLYWAELRFHYKHMSNKCLVFNPHVLKQGSNTRSCVFKTDCYVHCRNTVYVDSRILGFYSVQYCRKLPTFRIDLLPLSSRCIPISSTFQAIYTTELRMHFLSSSSWSHSHSSLLYSESGSNSFVRNVGNVILHHIFVATAFWTSYHS